MAGVKKLQVLGFPKADEIDPDKVIFPDGLNTTYAIGKVTLTNGMGTLVEPGGTLTDFFNVFVDEKNPTITQPSVSLTFSQAKAYEVGTYITPSYSATLKPGSYSYGPATDVVATGWTVSDTNNNISEIASGNFPELQVTDGIDYKITAEASHGAGAIPVTNMGNEYADGQILSGTKSATSNAVTGYRNTFYGSVVSTGEITSDVIRSLTKSDKALTAGSTFSVPVNEGALRAIFAYPADLRNVSRVEDVNGMGAVVTDSFATNCIIVKVEGANGYDAIDYKVYYLPYAGGANAANKFNVTI
jgi:hypothetical protein